ncbi:MAG: NUDIX hydrolase [Saprospiraceae bacterium]
MKRSIRVLVSVLIWRKHGLLLLRRRRNFQEIDTGRGLWELPGGQVNWGEWPEQAARREIREETGWRSGKKFRWRNYLVYHLKTPRGQSYRLQLLYNLRLSNKQLSKVQLSDEHDDFIFIQTAAELNKLNMLPEVKRYLLVALTGQVWIKPETVTH